MTDKICGDCWLEHNDPKCRCEIKMEIISATYDIDLTASTVLVSFYAVNQEFTVQLSDGVFRTGDHCQMYKDEEVYKDDGDEINSAIDSIVEAAETAYDEYMQLQES